MSVLKVVGLKDDKLYAKMTVGDIYGFMKAGYYVVGCDFCETSSTGFIMENVFSMHNGCFFFDKVKAHENQDEYELIGDLMLVGANNKEDKIVLEAFLMDMIPKYDCFLVALKESFIWPPSRSNYFMTK